MNRHTYGPDGVADETTTTYVFTPRWSKKLFESPAEGRPRAIIEGGGRMADEVDLFDLRKAIWEPFVDLSRLSDSRAQVHRDSQNGNYTITLQVKENGLTVRMTVDPKKGFLPVKRELYTPGTDRYMRCQFEDFRQVEEGLWLPFRYVFTTSTGVANIYEVKNAKVNVEIPEDLLDFPFPQGTIVRDRIANLRYTVDMGEGSYGERNLIEGLSQPDALLQPGDIEVSEPAREEELESASRKGQLLGETAGPAVADASPLRDKSSSKRNVFLLLWTAIFAIAGICVVVFIVLRKARAIERRDNPTAGNTKRRKLSPIVVIVALAVCIVSAYFLLLGTGRLVHKKSEQDGDRADLNSSGSLDEASEYSRDSAVTSRPPADEAPAQSAASQTRVFNDHMNETILEMFELATGPEDLDEGVEELGDYFPIDKDVLPLLLKEIETRGTDLVSNEQMDSLFSVLEENLYAYNVGSAALILADRLRAKYSIRPVGTKYQLGVLKRHYAKEGEILPSDPEEIMRLFVDRNYGGKDGSGYRDLYNELSVQGSAIHFRKSDVMPIPLGEFFTSLFKIGAKTCKNGMITRYPNIEYENSPERVVKEYGTLLYADVKVAASDADGLKYSRWKRYYWSPEDGSWLPMELVSFYAKTRKADEFF